MRTVDFDTATVDPIKLRELTKEQLTLTYAIYFVMESKLWQFAHANEAFDDTNWRVRNKSVTNALDIIGATYVAQFPEDCFVWNFRGCSTDDKYTHYGIQEAIEKTLGTDGITMDSESSWFVVDTTDARKEGLERFLKDCIPALKFTAEPADREFVRPPTIHSWNDAESIVKKAKVKVTVAMPKLSPKSPEIVKELVDDAVRALRMTGLPKTEAAERLIEALGVDTYFE
jgi:hypothetical protein